MTFTVSFLQASISLIVMRPTGMPGQMLVLNPPDQQGDFQLCDTGLAEDLNVVHLTGSADYATADVPEDWDSLTIDLHVVGRNCVDPICSYAFRSPCSYPLSISTDLCFCTGRQDSNVTFGANFTAKANYSGKLVRLRWVSEKQEEIFNTEDVRLPEIYKLEDSSDTLRVNGNLIPLNPCVLHLPVDEVTAINFTVGGAGTTFLVSMLHNRTVVRSSHTQSLDTAFRAKPKTYPGVLTFRYRKDQGCTRKKSYSCQLSPDDPSENYRKSQRFGLVFMFSLGCLLGISGFLVVFFMVWLFKAVAKRDVRDDIPDYTETRPHSSLRSDPYRRSIRYQQDADASNPKDSLPSASVERSEHHRTRSWQD